MSEQEEKGGSGVLLGLLLLAAVIGAALVYSQVTNNGAIPKLSLPFMGPTARVVTLRCNDCADIGMDVNLWTSMQHTTRACSVPNGTHATLLSMERNTDEARYYYHVSTARCDGWLLASFVQP